MSPDSPPAPSVVVGQPSRAPDRPQVSAETARDVAEEVPGANGDSPAELPARAWWAITKRVWVMTGFHNLSLLAAGVAFYAFLAFVPLIASVVLIYGLVGDPATVAAGVDQLEGLAPPEVVTILRDQMMAIVTTSKTAQGIGLGIALFFSLFGAMRAATAMISALNIVNEEYETRSIIRTTLVALAMTLGMIAVAIVGVLAISLFAYARNVLTGYIGNTAATLVQVMTWIVAGALVSFTFAVFFRFAPDRRAAKWRWLSVGSVLSTLLWVAITFGFAFYVANITDYNATYGSLGAIVIFLMWLFLSAYAVLIGAEVNAEAERQTFVDSTVGPDRPIGRRGAVMADSVVLDEASRALLEKKRRREARDQMPPPE